MGSLEQKKVIQPRASLSPDENLVVGMVGGTLETLLLMPVITYKFCKQEGRPYPRFPGMYRGVAVQAGSVAPLTALQLMFNGLYESFYRSMKTNQEEAKIAKLSEVETIGCAMLAGATSAVLYSPVDLVMIHQQKRNLSPFSTIKYILSTHGVTGLFRGFPPCAIREALYSAGYLGLAPVFTTKMLELYPNLSYYSAALLSATAAGIISNLASHPVDTVKTNLQADISKVKYRHSFQTLALLSTEKGVKGLFQGGFARTFRGCGAFFVVATLREQCIQNKTQRDSPWRFT